MTTTTSSSKIRFCSLLRGALQRNLGIGIYLSVAMAFFFPLQYILELERLRTLASYEVQNSYYYTSFAGPANIHTTLSVVAMVFILLAAPLVLSVVQNSYMHSRRAVDLYHSLPITRGQLLRVNSLAVFLIIAVPLVLCYLAILAIGGFYVFQGSMPSSFVYEPAAILLDLAGWLCTEAAVIAVMMLVGVLVGSSFENIVFGMEVLGAAPLIVAINHLLFGAYLVGYSDSLVPRDFALLSPMALMVCRYADSTNNENMLYYNILILVWLAVAAVLFILAEKLYRKRKSEVAQTPGVGGLLGVGLRAIAVYIGAVAIGSVFTAFNGNKDSTFVVGVAIGGFLTILLMEAVLNRGFKGLRKAMPAAAVLVIAVTVLAGLLVGGGLGYENRMPDAAKVQSVTISYRGRFSNVAKALKGYRSSWYSQENGPRGQERVPYYSYELEDSVTLTSPQAIDLVQRYHQALLQCNLNPPVDQAYRSYNENGFIEYRLPGGVMQRNYSISDAASRKLLLELETVEEFRQKTNPVFWMDEEDVTSIVVADRWGKEDSGRSLEAGRVHALLEALRLDMTDEEARRFLAGDVNVIGYLQINTKGSDRGNVPLEKDTALSFSLPVLDTYTHTLDVLKQQGYGEYLQPIPLDDMDFVGVNTYVYNYDRYSSAGGLWQISGYLQDMFPESGKSKEFEYRETQKEVMDQLIQNAKPVLINPEGLQEVLYITPVWKDHAGVTFAVLMKDIPKTVLDEFPYLTQKYGFKAYSQTVAAEPAVNGS